MRSYMPSYMYVCMCVHMCSYATYVNVRALPVLCIDVCVHADTHACIALNIEAFVYMYVRNAYVLYSVYM
jgi:hypothetical protein